MDRTTSTLVCYAVAFAATGVCFIPGMSIGVIQFSAYISGIAVGVIVGATMSRLGWLFVSR